MTKEAEYEKFFFLYDEGIKLNDFLQWGSAKQVANENAIVLEAERIAKEQGRSEELQKLFDKCDKATADECLEWLLDFFGVKEKFYSLDGED